MAHESTTQGRSYARLALGAASPPAPASWFLPKGTYLNSHNLTWTCNGLDYTARPLWSSRWEGTAAWTRTAAGDLGSVDQTSLVGWGWRGVRGRHPSLFPPVQG